MKKKTPKRKIKYTDEPLGDYVIVKDFFPSPKELVFKEEQVKVTMSLNKETVDFFKEQAKKHHTHYQKMIRNLLNHYTSNFH